MPEDLGYQLMGTIPGEIKPETVQNMLQAVCWGASAQFVSVLASYDG